MNYPLRISNSISLFQVEQVGTRPPNKSARHISEGELYREGYLLAGGHRLMALRVLNPSTREAAIQALISQERARAGSEGADRTRELIYELLEGIPLTSEVDFSQIPVRPFDFSSHQDHDRALEVEIAETAVRKDFSPQEIMSLYQCLLAKGYCDPVGRPRRGERAVKPIIASLLGISVRTVRRKLKQAQLEQNRSEREWTLDEVKKAICAARRAQRALSHLSAAAEHMLRSSIEWSVTREELLGTLQRCDCSEALGGSGA